jgi:hypothetical protein
MPFTSRFIPERRVVVSKISFPLSFADIRTHVELHRRDGTWVYPELVDARDIGRIDFAQRDMLSIAHFVRDRLGERPIAPRAVVVDTPRGFMMGRVFASLVAGWIRIGIFEDMETAEDWLESQREDAAVTA